MASFGLAFYWDTPEAALAAGEFLRNLAEPYPREKLVKLELYRRQASLVFFLELPFTYYSRKSLDDLEKQTVKAGGKMIEMMRLGETEKQEFKAKFLTSSSGPLTFDAYAKAASNVEEFLRGLRIGAGSGRVVSTVTPPSIPRPAPPRPAVAPATSPGAAGRTEPRYDVQLEVEFKTDEALRTEYVSNLSKGGAFVRTAKRPVQNTTVTLKLHLPNGMALDTTARVVHVFDHPEHGGVGLVFEKRDAVFEGKLSQYLASLPKKA